MLSDLQITNLENNKVDIELLKENGLNDPYYLDPLHFINDELHLVLPCTGREYKEAVETANDEDFMPEWAGVEVVVDGILAIIYSDYLDAVGIPLITYFTYRFQPPSHEFQNRLDKFKSLIEGKVEVVE